MAEETPITPAPEPTPAPAPEPAPMPAPEPAPAPVAEVLPPEQQTMSGGELAVTIICSLFFSLAVPLTLWVVWNQTYPAKAKQALKVFWIILIVSFLLVCCAFAVGFSSIMAVIQEATRSSGFYY